MRTTVDLPPPLLSKAKRLAAERSTSLSTVISDALGAYLGATRRRPDEPFQLIVRGRAEARFPTATEIAAVADEEELAALHVPGVPCRVAL